VSKLIVALAAFVGTHFLMSHPLRAPMAKALGATGFQAAYSLISLAAFIWIMWAFSQAPGTEPLWIAGDGLWAAASVLMLLGSILFAGSFLGNPALPRPDASDLASAPARGMLAVTRHPMMWSFAIWSLVHLLVSPHEKVIWLTVGMAVLALGGSWGQDRKKAVLMGTSWQDWRARTSFIPFGNQITGKTSWASVWPGGRVILAGAILWLVVTYGHAWFGIYGAGVWRWLWA
jgi:uncharacterized membrane protein